MFRLTALIRMTLGFALITAAMGCGLIGGDDDDDDDDLERDQRISTRNPDRNDRNNDRRGDDEGLEANMRAAGIPVDAEIVARGESRDLTYTAREDGTIYVQDRDENDRVVYSGQIYRNERFAIDGQTHRFTVEGRNVLTRDVRGDHKYRVFFVPKR